MAKFDQANFHMLPMVKDPRTSVVFAGHSMLSLIEKMNLPYLALSSSIYGGVQGSSRFKILLPLLIWKLDAQGLELDY